MKRILTLAITAIIAGALGYGIGRVQTTHQLKVASANVADLQWKMLDEKVKMSKMEDAIKEIWQLSENYRKLEEAEHIEFGRCIAALQSGPSVSDISNYNASIATQEIAWAQQQMADEMTRQRENQEQAERARKLQETLRSLGELQGQPYRPPHR